MSDTSTITLELRTSRDAEHTATTAEQFLMALPNPPRGLLNIFKKAPAMTLEILNQGQVTYFFLTCPEHLKDYVKSQLTAVYPEMMIKELEHDVLDELRDSRFRGNDGRDPIATLQDDKGGRDSSTESTPPTAGLGMTNSVPPEADLREMTMFKAVGELRFSAPTYLPLKTSADFANTDPLSTILSTLSKTQPGDTVLVQYTVRKAKDNWKNSAQNLVSDGIKQSDGTFQPHPLKTQIEAKISQACFQTNIRLLVQSSTKDRAQSLLESVAQAFHTFDTPHQSLVLKKPRLSSSGLISQILERNNTKFGHQYLSTPELATLFHLPNKQLATVKNIAWGKNLLGEPPEELPFYEIPASAGMTNFQEKAGVNLFAKTEYKNQERIFGIKDSDRRRHMYVIGKSGTGKSTLLANMIINDLKQNRGVAVIDPHGDLFDTVINYIPKHRINDVIVFDPTDPEAVVKLNLFEGGNVVHRELIASGIVAIFQKLYANSWGPRLEYILRNTLLTLLSTNAKLDDILKMLTDDKYRAKVIEHLDDPVLKNFWVNEFNAMQDRQRNEAISPILNKVGQFVTSPLIRNVVNTSKSSFSIEDVMDQGKILLVNLSQGKLGEDNTALIGAMLITKIQLAAMNRVYLDEADRRDFFFYIDEFQNFATTSFIKILSEARKYRLSLILANQYIDQIPTEIKSAIFGNVGTIVSFILGASDADWMNKEFGNKYTSEDLVSLARYQIILKLSIDNRLSAPFPAFTLPLATSSNQNREKVLKVSRERYAKKR